MDERNNENPLQNLSFADSWKQPVIQVGLAGTVIAGSVFIAGKGDPVKLYESFKKSGKKTLDRIERYVDKQIGPVAKLMKSVAKKTVPNAWGKVFSKDVPAFRPGEYREYVQKQIDTVNGNEVLNEAATKLSLEENKARLKRIYENPTDFHYHKAMREAISKKLPTTTERNELLKQKKDKPFDWKGVVQDSATASVVGSTFAMGITGWHALDQKMNPSTAQKNKEKAFEVAGSYLSEKQKNKQRQTFFESTKTIYPDQKQRFNKNNQKRFPQKRGGEMQKKASIEALRRMYEVTTDLGQRPAQALATGLGFTGVSLGSAALLKNNPSLVPGLSNAMAGGGEKEKESSSPRIIIELGKENSTNPAEMGMGMGLLPKQGTDYNGGFLKTANQPFVGALKNYFKNLGGRYDEVSKLDDRIKNYRYKTDAVQKVDTMPLDETLTANFKNLPSEPELKRSLYEELVEREADMMKMKDVQNRQAIKDEVIKARLGTLGGAATLGGTGLGLAYLTRDKKPQEE